MAVFPVTRDSRSTSPAHGSGGRTGEGGLTEREAQRRLAESRQERKPVSSRSYASIVRANVLTVFNLILASFGGVTLAFGDARDALFLGIIIANSGIGITQEVRAKRALDRLTLLVAPKATVKREYTHALIRDHAAKGKLVVDI